MPRISVGISYSYMYEYCTSTHASHGLPPIERPSTSTVLVLILWSYRSGQYLKYSHLFSWLDLAHMMSRLQYGTSTRPICRTWMECSVLGLACQDRYHPPISARDVRETTSLAFLPFVRRRWGRRTGYSYIAHRRRRGGKRRRRSRRRSDDDEMTIPPSTNRP